jgi:tetratricopeptide (TPR) repeat protein
MKLKHELQNFRSRNQSSLLDKRKLGIALLYFSLFSGVISGQELNQSLSDITTTNQNFSSDDSEDKVSSPDKINEETVLSKSKPLEAGPLESSSSDIRSENDLTKTESDTNNSLEKSQLTPEETKSLLEQRDILKAGLADSESSPFSVLQLDQWQALGQIEEKLGNYEDALSAYNFAWQASRVNEGLYSLSQLPFLRSIISVMTSQANFKEVDNRQTLSLLINKHQYPTGTAQRINAMLNYAQWKLQAAHESYKDVDPDLMNLTRALDREIEQMELMEEIPAGLVGRVALQLQLSTAQLELANYIENQPLELYMDSSQGRYESVMQCQVVRLPNGQTSRICQMVEVPNINLYADPSIRRRQAALKQLNSSRKNINRVLELLRSGPDDDPALIDLAKQTQDLLEYYDITQSQSFSPRDRRGQLIQ